MKNMYESDLKVFEVLEKINLKMTIYNTYF